MSEAQKRRRAASYRKGYADATAEIDHLKRVIAGQEEQLELQGNELIRRNSHAREQRERAERAEKKAGILRRAVDWCLDRDERNGSLPAAYSEKLHTAKFDDFMIGEQWTADEVAGFDANTQVGS